VQNRNRSCRPGFAGVMHNDDASDYHRRACRPRADGKGERRYQLRQSRVYREGPRARRGSGIAVDLAREFGRQLGVAVELVSYNSGGQLTAGLTVGGWDVATLAFEQARANAIHFGAPFVETDATCLVHAGSPLRTAADVDQKGVRIVVSAKDGNDLFLTRTLKNAPLMRASSPEAAFKLFAAENLDADANLKPGLRFTGLPIADARPTSRIVSVVVPFVPDVAPAVL